LDSDRGHEMKKGDSAMDTDHSFCAIFSTV
jgi:hypothetical protein